MKKYNITIELLSDLCVSDGGVYNSLLDTDVCYDRYGIPYIPAKRIRGCLRECALELKDWGADIDISKLFGDKGDAKSAASLRIGNAYLQGYEELRDLADKYKTSVVMHPQNVLSVFTYVRMQTSIDQETGIADDASLRSMRVIDKGLRFTASVEVKEEYAAQLSDCCNILRHMGIARTRGYGEVSVRLEECTKKERNKETEHVAYKEGTTRLEYEIKLEEPMICKSLNGEEANTLDYIEGSKVLGMISQLLPEEYLTFMEKGKIRCSNAYISNGGVRYTEAPAYLFSIKNNKKILVDKRYENSAEKSIKEGLENEQKNQIRHCYYTENGNKINLADVVTEKRYHHRRPKDKSIGRAVSGADNDADFYQMDSIAEGQVFSGFVEGSAEQIKEIYELLTNAGSRYMGYSRTSEYGKVQIRVTGMDKADGGSVVNTKKFAVRLISPAIVYSDKAMAATDPEELKKEICKVLGIPQDIKTVNFLRYTSVGGYNTTWNKRKPIISAFDKGTAIYMELQSEIALPADGRLWIGERTTEGYGECKIEIMTDEADKYVCNVISDNEEAGTEEFVVDDALKADLCKPLLDAFVRDYAILTVDKRKNEYLKSKTVMKPTISNMILMAKENKSIAEVEEVIKSRYDKKSIIKTDKKQSADMIMKDVNSSLENLIPDFEKKYHIKGMTADQAALGIKYLSAYLTQVKYLLRDKKEDKENG